MMEALKRIAVLDEEDEALAARLRPYGDRLALMASDRTCADAAHAAAKEKLDANRKALRELEVDLAANAERQAKERRKVEAVTSVKAAQAAQHEIEALTAKQREVEDRMLERMEAAESLETLEAEARQAAARARAEEETLSAEVAAARAEIDAILAGHDLERKNLLPGLKPDLQKRYAALVAGRTTPAVMRVSGKSCPGCQASIKPNALAHLHAGEPVVCDSCRRILVRSEESGVRSQE